MSRDDLHRQTLKVQEEPPVGTQEQPLPLVNSVKMKLTDIYERIYADFFMPSQLAAYREFLKHLIDCGYRICSVAFLWERISRGPLMPTDRYVVLRHDVDSDVATAKAMWQIERELGLTTSYYFRLSTLDVPFMREIQLSGGEASYHFEEIATVAKEKYLRTPEAVSREMAYIRETFKRNLESLRAKTGLPMKIVAAHGDFVNERLRVYNWEILKDTSFRKDVDVELEVYDEAFMRHITSRHSEVLTPHLWTPDHPFKAAEAANPIVHILVHPGNWQANPRENLLRDLKRAWEGVRYSYSL